MERSISAAMLGLAVLAGTTDAATNVPVQLRIAFTGPSGSLTPELSWASQPGAVYKLQHRYSLGSDGAWETFEPVTAVSNVTSLRGRSIPENSIEFFRLLLPEPEIFTIEPARFAFGGPVELYVIGQCFGTNTQLRVGPLTLTNRVIVNPNLMQATFTPSSPGAYVFELVVAGAVRSSFLVECYEAGAPPPSVLQGPPEESWAAPHFREVTGLDVYIDCLEIQEGGLNSGAHKVKEKGNRTKCSSNLRVTPSGELEADEVDMFIPGVGLDFVWGRRYLSRSGPNTEQGNRWDYSYNVSVRDLSGAIEVRDGMGRVDVLQRDADGNYGRDELFYVGQFSNSLFRITFADSGYWEFHPFDGSATAGRIARIVDRNGNTLRLEYDAPGRLARVIDTLDRTNTIAYSAVNGKISSVTDFSGRRVTYAYYRTGDPGGNDGDLKSVTSPAVTGTPNGNDFPTGKTTTYAYSRGFADPRENSLLLTITDPKGQTAYKHVYQHNQTDLEFLRCIGRQVGTTNDRLTYAYLPQSPSPANRYATLKVIVNDRVGNVSEHLFDARLRELQRREFTGRAIPGLRVSDTTNRPAGKLRADDPAYFETRFEWNADSLCTRVVHPRGNATEMVYQRAYTYNQNSARSNHPKRHDGNLRVIRERACCGGADTDGDGVPDTETLVARFEHDPRFGTTRAKDTNGNYVVVFNEIFVSHIIAPGGGGGGSGGCFITKVTDARGAVATASYDARGNLLHTETIERKSGQVVACDFNYNTKGQRTVMIHPADGEGRRRRDECFYHASGPQAGYLAEHVKDCVITGFHLTNRYEYDARGNVTRCIDPRGFDTTFTYNALDQVMTRQTPNTFFGTLVRYATSFTYDANDNLVQVDHENRDQAGMLDATNPSWTSFAEYDLLNRQTLLAHEVAHVVQQRSVTNRFFYDGNDNLVLQQLPEAVSGDDPNNVVSYLYDERDLPFQITRAPGVGLTATCTEQFDYNPNGQCSRVSKIDSFTIKQTIRVHDGFDRCVQTIDALGNVEFCAFDPNDNLVLHRTFGETNDVPGGAGNRRLGETRYEYDSLNRCVRSRMSFFDIFTEVSIGDGESTQSASFAPNGLLLSETDDNGNITRYAYDSAHRLSSIIDPRTNVTACLRDRAGNVTTLTQIDRSDLSPTEQTFTTSYAYDGLNRCVSSSNNVGNVAQSAYDSRDNCVSEIDARGHETFRVFDGLNRCIDTTHYTGLRSGGITINTTHVEYKNERCLSTTDGNGNTTRYAYDALDRLVATTNADQTVESLIWSPRSNLASRTDPNGTVTVCTYDLLDRCIRKDITVARGVAPTTTFEAFSYDGLSRLVLGTNNTSMVEFSYDSMSNLEKAKADCIAAFASFDGEGNRISVTYPSGRIMACAYARGDLLSSVSTMAFAGDAPATLATFSYDGAGRLSRIARGNGVNTRLNWNGTVNPANSPGDLGWQQVSIVNHQRAQGGAIIDRRIAAYDANQNRTLRQQTTPFPGPVPATTTNVFAYDALNRLQSYSRNRASTAYTRNYALDANGNRLSVSSNGLAQAYGMDATLPEPGDFQMNQYSFTPFGEEQHDRNGNVTARGGAAGATYFHYDCADRLVGVETTVGAALVPVVSFTYDVLGRRISKTIYPPAPAAAQTTQFIYDGEHIMESRQNGATSRGFYWIPEVDDEVLCLFNAGGALLYFHNDDLGNVLALTDSKANVLERYDYDDYGVPRFLDSGGVPIGINGMPVVESTVGNPFLFRGMEWDAETALYHDSGLSGDNPMYEPKTGRYLGRGHRDVGRYISWNGDCAGSGESAFAGDNPWTVHAMKKGTVKFFNEAKGFGRTGGGGGGGTLRSHEDLHLWADCGRSSRSSVAPCAPMKMSMSGRCAAVAAAIIKETGATRRAKGTVTTVNPPQNKGGFTIGPAASPNAVRSSVQDFEKNTEGVSGGFGLNCPDGPGDSGSAKFTSACTLGGSKELQTWWQEAAKGKSIRKNITINLRGHRDVGGYRAGLIVPIAMDKGLRSVSNRLKTRHDTVKNSVGNIR